MNALFMFALLCVAQPDESADKCPASIVIKQRHMFLKDCRALQDPILNADRADADMFPACIREVGVDTTR